MQMTNHFRMMAAYNAWANARLWAGVEMLTDGQYRADRGAFFRSVHGTMNHLLVTDRIWMHRFTGTGDLPTRLDEILFHDLAELRAARSVEDRRIVTFVDGLDEAGLDRMLRYARASVAEFVEQRLVLALSHVFNHQTHHRGQIHALLTSLAGRAPELDLLFFQRANPDLAAAMS